MLQLRRSEKDFMLRRDIKYVQAFDNGVVRFLTQVQQSNLSFTQKEQLTADIKDYRINFNNLVDKEVLFGLSDKDGLMAELRDKIYQTDNDTLVLREQTLAEIANDKNQAFILGLSIFLLIAAVLCIATLLIIRSIINPVRNITSVISSIEVSKDLSMRCDESGNDELSLIAHHFNRMLMAFQDLIQQVNESVTAMNESCHELSRNAVSASEGVLRQLNC
jgi:methyl-accepting chemotaxis protein